MTNQWQFFQAMMVYEAMAARTTKKTKPHNVTLSKQEDIPPGLGYSGLSDYEQCLYRNDAADWKLCEDLLANKPEPSTKEQARQLRDLVSHMKGKAGTQTIQTLDPRQIKKNREALRQKHVICSSACDGFKSSPEIYKQCCASHPTNLKTPFPSLQQGEVINPGTRPGQPLIASPETRDDSIIEQAFI